VIRVLNHHNQEGKPPAVPLLLLLSSLVFILSCQTNPVRDELAETYYNLGNAYLDLNRLGDAESAYARAFELDSSLYVAGYNLARVHIFSGNYQSAVTLLKELIAEDPENVILRESLAWAYLEMGRTDESESLYQILLDQDTANCNVRYNLALLLSDRGEWEECYDILIECVLLEEEDADILYLLGRAERESARGDGIVWLEDAIEKEPANSTFLYELARAYRSEGIYDKALSVLDEILESDPPEQGSYLFEKARILYTAFENVEEGTACFEQALNAGFDEAEDIADFLGQVGFKPQSTGFEDLEELLKDFELYEAVIDQFPADEEEPPDEKARIPEGQ